MDTTLSMQIQAWLNDAATLQRILLVLLAGLAVLAWLYRRSAGQLGAERTRAGDAAARLREQAGELADLSAANRGQEVRLARIEAESRAQLDRMQELADERDGLRDALHSLHQGEADLRRQLAETRLAAEKDREAAARDIATLRELRDEMSRNFKLLADETLRNQGEDMKKRHGEQLAALLTPFRDQVHRFQTELQTRNKQTDEERASLRTQIEMLHRRSEDISREAVALTRALKGDRQKQGAWGEMILERLLEESGLQRDIHYLTQETRKDGDGRRWRPDVVVKLPRDKVLVIDSKVSLSAYEEAVNAGDPLAAETALKRHVTAIRAHITALSGKGYQSLDDGSVDYVLMFIPIEGAFSEAMRTDPELASFAMERRVGLATPTTLMLTLRTVDHIWTVERRESNAMQIANRAGQLYDKLHGFVSAVEDVGVALDRAQKSHALAMDRLTRGQGNVVRQAEMLRELGARAQKRLALDHDGQEEPPAPEEAPPVRAK